MNGIEGPALLTPAEVGRLYAVNAKTVTRWAKAGKLTPQWTIGGHRRYFRAEVEALINGGEPLTPEQVRALQERLLAGAR